MCFSTIGKNRGNPLIKIFVFLSGNLNGVIGLNFT